MANRSFFREILQVYTSIVVLGVILVFGLFARIAKFVFQLPVRMAHLIRAE